MPDEDLKDVILGVVEASLDAQLRAVRRLRRGEPAAAAARSRFLHSSVLLWHRRAVSTREAAADRAAPTRPPGSACFS